MGYFSYLDINTNRLMESGCSMAPSSSVDGFPGANALALPISKPHRFTGCTSETYTIDLGAEKTAGAIALINHNLTAGATITVYAGDSPNPNGTQWSHIVTMRAQDAFFIFPAEVTYRYWKITLQNAPNPAGYIQVGLLMLCPVPVMAFNFAYGWRLMDRFENATKKTEYGTPHTTRLYQQTSVELPFKNLDDDDMETLRAFVLSHYGNLTPFFLIPDIAVNDGWFGRLVNASFDQQVDYYRSMTLQFEQDGPGRTLTA